MIIHVNETSKDSVGKGEVGTGEEALDSIMTFVFLLQVYCRTNQLRNFQVDLLHRIRIAIFALLKVIIFKEPDIMVLVRNLICKAVKK